MLGPALRCRAVQRSEGDKTSRLAAMNGLQTNAGAAETLRRISSNATAGGRLGQEAPIDMYLTEISDTIRSSES